MEPKERHGSPIFYKLLEKAAEVHDKKSHDYVSNQDPFANYKFAGEIAVRLFSHSPDDAGFCGRLMEKLYRLSNLGKDSKAPLNESIEDTEEDLITIMALWMACRRDSRWKEDPTRGGKGVSFKDLEPPPPTQPTPFRCRSCEREFNDRQRIEVGNKFYCSNICAKLGSGSRVGYHICRYCNATLSTKYVTDSTSNIFCDAECRDKHWQNSNQNG